MENPMNAEQTNLFLDRDTLADARESVQRGLEKGLACPCCNQFCKLYPRQIHSTIARGLIRFYRMSRGHPGEYMHVDRLCPDRKTSGDFAKLAMWKLIEECPKTPEDTMRRTSGFWKLTEIGIAFIERKIRVPRVKFVYNDRIMGESQEQVDITDCLKERFNYAELMAEGDQCT
jgi:hypothetical protein